MIGRVVTRLFGVFALLVGQAAGCTIDADYDETAFSCGDDGPCPPGFHCRAGVCVSDDAPDGGLGAVCGADRALADLDGGFTGEREGLWNVDVDGGAEVSFGGGELALTLAASVPSSAIIDSVCSYNLDGARVSVELVDLPEHGRAIVEARSPSGEQRFAFEIEDGTLTTIVEDGGDRQSVSVDVSDRDHGYVALSAQDGAFVLEVSADGTAWLPVESHDTPASADSLSIRFAAESDDELEQPEIIRLSDLRAAAMEP